MTNMDNYQTYYVYHHVDPTTNKAVYVGLGQYDRAWCVRKNNRSENHVRWVEAMHTLGYTLNDLVFIVAKQLSKEDAKEREKKDIEELTPVFNKFLNKNHWGLGRNVDAAFCREIKALREMGYLFKDIAFLSGSSKPIVNAMTMKRWAEYV